MEEGGFSCNLFVEKPSTLFDCPVCFEVLKNPVQCQFGHAFCLFCISESFKRVHECPVCKIALDNIDLMSKSLIVSQMIGELDTLCPSNFENKTQIGGISSDECVKEVCAWTGPLHSRNHHYKEDCGYYRVKCPNGACEVELERRHIDKHVENCVFTSRPCPHCLEFCGDEHIKHYMRDEMEVHVSHDCEYVPTECALCKKLVPKHELLHIHNSMCPDVIVPCPLHQLQACSSSCPVEGKRIDIKEHITNGRDWLEVVTETTLVCQERLAKFECKETDLKAKQKNRKAKNKENRKNKSISGDDSAPALADTTRSTTNSSGEQSITSHSTTMTVQPAIQISTLARTKEATGRWRVTAGDPLPDNFDIQTEGNAIEQALAQLVQQGRNGIGL